MKIILTAFSLLIFTLSTVAQTPGEFSSSSVVLNLQKFNCTGSVLYIAAHPDDENTRLISWLVNEKHVRTGYLSLTRGDGGQNLIGSEQGIELGVIRTQELLAARRTDGGEQYFTRAYDFGYSKTPAETFEKWNHEEILSDVVYVIRKFRPDIIITRFDTDGSGGHGHHTASAILAQEAFEAAADPNRFPEQLKTVSVWKTKRMFYNNAARFWNPNADMSNCIKTDVGGFNKLLGKSYGEIAAESRSMHRSQGFGSAKQRGELFEYFRPVKGDTNSLTDIFQGIDLSWKSKPNGSKINSHIETAIKAYKNEDFKTCNNTLFQLLNLLQDNEDYNYHVKLLKKNILLINGIFLEATADGNYIPSLGDTLKVKTTCLNRSGLNVVLQKLSLQESGQVLDCQNSKIDSGYNEQLKFNTPKITLFNKLVCKNNNQSGLIWLSKGIKNNKFDMDQNWTAFPLAYESSVNIQVDLSIDGKTISWTMPVQYKWTDPEKGENYRPLLIGSPAWINLSSSVLVCSDTSSKEIKVIIKAGKDNVKGTLKAHYPANWKLRCEGQNPTGQTSGLCEKAISLAKKGEEQQVIFIANSTQNSGPGKVFFEMEIDGKTYKQGIKEIAYDHIPTQTIFPIAEIKLVKVDLIRKKKKIAYIPGAGDEVAACLSQIGYDVTILTDEQLSKEDLNQYETIITGIRAYNTNEKLTVYKSRLMNYVEKGGNLIVQYNTNSFAGPFKGDMGPYPFKLTRERITDEEAKVNFLLPQHSVLNKPNKISASDFEGWIQERSIYHAGDIDAHYEMPLTMNDPGEKPNNGSLIISNYGKGHFVYTGLVFFRELPAGVPGAYRLFVNLIELVD